MIIEVFVFDEELLKKDLDNYNFRLYIPESGGNRVRKIHPNDKSWCDYYKPIQVETSMYELHDVNITFSIVEIDDDILFKNDYSDRLYSYKETKKKDLAMNKTTFGDGAYSKMLERELKLKTLLTV